jgi:hypothetical protein
MTDDEFKASVQASIDRKSATSAPTEAPATASPDRDTARSIKAGLSSPSSSGVSVQDGLTIDGTEKSEPVNSVGMTAAEVAHVRAEGARISAEYRADPKRLAERSARTELALRDVHEVEHDDVEFSDEQITRLAALKRVNPAAYDAYLDELDEEEFSDLTFEEREELANGETSLEELGMVNTDQARQRVDDHITSEDYNQALMKQALLQGEIENAYTSAFQDAKEIAGRELGLSPEQTERYIEQAVQIPGLMPAQAGRPSEMVKDIKTGIATIQEAERADRSAKVGQQMLRSFQDTSVAANITTGEERLASVTGPDGIRRLVPVKPDPVTIVPHFDQARVDRAVAGRVERAMTGKEIAKAIAETDVSTSWQDGLTVNGKSATLAEADGSQREYEERQAERARKAGSGLVDAGWTT